MRRLPRRPIRRWAWEPGEGVLRRFRSLHGGGVPSKDQSIRRGGGRGEGERNSEMPMQLLPPAEASEGEPRATAAPAVILAWLKPGRKVVVEMLRAGPALLVGNERGTAGLPQALAERPGLERRGLVRQLPGRDFIRKLWKRPCSVVSSQPSVSAQGPAAASARPTDLARLSETRG